MNKKTLLHIAIITVIFCTQFFIVSPVGEFALNDDWVHTDAIKQLTTSGKLSLMSWAGPTFYTPILYGLALVEIFGFTFTLLRLSTLAITLALLLSVFFVIQKTTKRTDLAYIGVFLLWLNPMFYNLSFTFMTDIPTLLLLLLAWLAYKKGLQKQSLAYILIGSIISILGFYTRQTNILLFVAAGIIAFLGYKKHKNTSPWHIIYGFIVPGIILLLSYYILGIHHLLPAHLGVSHIISDPHILIKHMYRWIWWFALLVGISTSPLTLSWIIKNQHKIPHKKYILVYVTSIIAAIVLDTVWNDRLFHVGNIINTFGLGPSQVMAGKLQSIVSPPLQKLLTLYGSLSVVWLYITTKEIKTKTIQKNSILTIFFILYGLVIISVHGFDRYVLPLMLITIIFITQKLKTEKISYILLAILLFLVGGYSILQTKHYLTWNTARWELATLATTQTTNLSAIDAGYEWNGWHTYWQTQGTRQDIPQGTPWWSLPPLPQNTREYVVSFSNIKGYDIVKTEKIHTKNPNNTLYLLQKQRP